MLTGSLEAGQLLGALESKVKHAQCFDMALMKDGSIVLASKDYRLYIYRYVKVIADAFNSILTLLCLCLFPWLHISLPFVHRFPVWVQSRSQVSSLLWYTSKLIQCYSRQCRVSIGHVSIFVIGVSIEPYYLSLNWDITVTFCPYRRFCEALRCKFFWYGMS